MPILGAWASRRTTTTNRTDRLYAIVEELRARAPRTQPAARLAERFEVSVRTIERDLSSLQKIYYGASIMPVPVLQELRQRLPGVEL